MIGSSNAQAKVMITADSRQLERAIDTSKSALRRFGSSAAGAFKTGFGNVTSFLKRAFDPLGAGFNIAQGQVAEVLDYEEGIARLAISQGKANESMGDMRAQLTAVSSETGINRNQLMEGISAYQALTGDTAAATASLQVFADATQASGAAMKDIAATGAALTQGFKIDPTQYERAFDILISQGKAGSVEIKGMAAEMAGLAPAFAQFAGGTGLEGLTDFGASFQVAAEAFGGNASEAATGLQALMKAFSQNAGKFEKAGVKIFDKDPATGIKRFRGFRQVLTDIGNSKLAKDPTLFTKAIGSSEGARTYQKLAEGQQRLNDLVAVGEASTGTTQADKAQYLQSAAGQLTVAMNTFKLAVAGAFTPERIQMFAQAMAQVSEGLTVMIGKIEDAMRALQRARDLMNGDTHTTVIGEDSVARGRLRANTGLAAPKLGKTGEGAAELAAYNEQKEALARFENRKRFPGQVKEFTIGLTERARARQQDDQDRDNSAAAAQRMLTSITPEERARLNSSNLGTGGAAKTAQRGITKVNVTVKSTLELDGKQAATAVANVQSKSIQKGN